jgi:two-component sensor histidine kinase
MSIQIRNHWPQSPRYLSASDLRCENVRLRELLQAAEKKAAQSAIMLREADHRIKNSLQIVASRLSLQARREQDTPSAEVLRAAAIRIHAVSRLHDALQAGDGNGLLNLGSVFEKMTESLREMCGLDSPVAIQVIAEPVLAPLTFAQPVVLAVNELVLNALRHGYPHGRTGVVRISLFRTDHALRIIVADDGVGLPQDFMSAAGYGMKLVHMIAKQVGATLHADRVSGARFSLVAPGVYALAGQAVAA